MNAKRHEIQSRGRPLLAPSTLGGSVAISVTVTEILSIVAIVIVLAIVIFSIVGSRLDRKRK